jgi:mono/diheme cytochrome c family protein
MKKVFSKINIAYSLFLGLGVVIAISSCNDDPKSPGYEYMPDMYRSPSYETNSVNPNFKDSLTDRKPVAGTIPRGTTYMPYPYPNTPEGYEAAGRDLKNPFETNEANLAEGKHLFENFCMHCHGPEGRGDGSIIQNGKFPPPPSYSGPLKDLPVGKMFHTITYGKNLMGSHASQLNQTERWKVIMYVQTLQKLGAASMAKADSIKK